MLEALAQNWWVLLLRGLAAIVFGILWWAMLLVGILGLVTAVIALVAPGITATVMLVLIAVWAIARGIGEIAAAVRLRKVLDHEWLLGLAGVLSILFGIALIARPAAGLLAMVWLIGSFAVAFGVMNIALAFRLRTLKQKIQVRHEG
jgi:uncharacterized membrane protein HdeD (DUF308 family)